MTDKQERVIEIPLDWRYPKNLKSRYATNMIVQHGENEFIVSFFEAIPPVLLGTPEDRKSTLEQMGSVRADCVARIIVAADKMPTFIKALQENMDSYQEKFEQSKDPSE